jgi:hypothetical protein
LIISDREKAEKSIELEYRIHIIDLNDSPPKFFESIYLIVNSPSPSRNNTERQTTSLIAMFAISI